MKIGSDFKNGKELKSKSPTESGEVSAQLYESMPKRMLALIEAQRGHTEYLP